MIAIVDYGMGNLRSVEKAFLAVGHRAFITGDSDKVAKADKVVLPGVGAFGAAMENLRASGMADAVLASIRAGKPFLGICLGLQLLFTESEELGSFRGLDVIHGRVAQFFQPEDRTPETEKLKVPHMGWNSLDIRLPALSLSKGPAPLLKDFPAGGSVSAKATTDKMVYFVHSYYVIPEDRDVIAATTQHGIVFCSAIWKDNIFAVQFHPEKSGALGLTILKRFGDMEV
jgi:glutamine amidotransferase